jgi:hypothetical protein
MAEEVIEEVIAPEEEFDVITDVATEEEYKEILAETKEPLDKAHLIAAFKRGEVMVERQVPKGTPQPEPKPKTAAAPTKKEVTNTPYNKTVPDPDAILAFLNEDSEEKFEDVGKWKETNLAKNKSLATLRAEKEEMAQQMELLKNAKSNPFANETIAKLNAFAKNFPDLSTDVFYKVSGISDKTSDMEKAKIYFSIKHPEYEGDMSLIEAKLNRDYDLEHEDETQAKLNKIGLKAYANEATAYFNDIVSKSTPEEVVFPDAQKVNEMKAALKTSWSKEIDGFDGADNELKFTHEWTDDKNKKYSSEFEYKIPKGDLKSIKDMALDILVNAGAEVNPKNIEQAKVMALDIYTKKNQGKIISNIVTAKVAEAIIAEKKAKANPVTKTEHKQPEGETRTASQIKADKWKKTMPERQNNNHRNDAA